jgi:hypothetical protein
MDKRISLLEDTMSKKISRDRQAGFTTFLFFVVLLNVAQGRYTLAVIFGLAALGALIDLLRIED